MCVCVCVCVFMYVYMDTCIKCLYNSFHLLKLCLL